MGPSNANLIRKSPKKNKKKGPPEHNSHGKTNECPTIRELTYEQPEVDYQSDEMVWHSQMQR